MGSQPTEPDHPEVAAALVANAQEKFIPATASAGRVLLADDDAIVARVLARVLTNAGYRFSSSPNGRLSMTSRT
jgi:hypothetical protein